MVVYCCRQRCTAERRQRGYFREQDRQKPWERPVSSRNKKEMEGKMLHVANYCSEKFMAEYCDFLPNRPGRYTRRSI